MRTAGNPTKPTWGIRWFNAILRAFPLFTIALVFTPLFAPAQTVSTLISKDKMVIGEQVQVQIRVENLQTADIQQDFSFPDTVNHLEILSDTSEVAGPNTLLYTLVITSFDSGYWQLPSFELVLNGNRRLATEALGISVLPVDVSNMEDYHDLKDIMEPVPINNWYIVAVIVLLAIVSLFAFLWFIRRKEISEPLPATPITSLEALYDLTEKEMARLELADRSDRLSLTVIFRELTLLTHRFADAAYGENSLHLTSGEYMVRVKGRMSNPETESAWFQFLRLADAVKFARYQPSASEISGVFPVNRLVIKQIYQNQKSRG